MSMIAAWTAVGAVTVLWIGRTVTGHEFRQAPGLARVELRPCRVPDIPEPVRCGSYRVFEDREHRRGRMLSLDIVVLPAQTRTPLPDPVFELVGGPGQTATAHAANHVDSPLRRERDIVFVDQRGTGGGHRLDCPTGSDSILQSYFEPMFRAAAFATCRARLALKADLRLYSTPIAVDDFAEVIRAMGYPRVNLQGGSYGSRAALVFLRQHPDLVRTIVLTAISPFSFKNPLYHAWAAQRALDSLLAQCGREPACHSTFPDTRAELATVLDRLAQAPARVPIQRRDGSRESVTLGRDQFAEALRVMLYSPEQAGSIPLLIHRAEQGDYQSFAELGLEANRGLRRSIRYGMLMSVICAEDIDRITEAEIVAKTANTFLGDRRVRQQIAACHGWPRSHLPADYATPFQSSTPALLVSARSDPSTPPEFGFEAARTFLPNALHVVIPGGHSAASPCTDRIGVELIQRGTGVGIDTSCVRQVTPVPFQVR